jgi:Sulfotransferase domain
MPKTRKNMVWLASYPKSGNTWLRIFLSNLCSCSPQPVNINELTETPISSSRDLIDRYLGIHSSELTNEEIDNLRPEVYKRISEEQEELSYHKTHDAWTINSNGKPIFPAEISKGAIYIIRNPLDIAISYSFHNNRTIDQTISVLNDINARLCGKKEKLDIQVQQILTSWSDHVISWVERSKFPIHVMRYEDMLDNPLNSFRFALEFLQLDYTETEIVQALDHSSFSILQKMEASEGFKERSIHSESFFRNGKSGEWKTELSDVQINKIVSHHKEIMQRFGYLTH